MNDPARPGRLAYVLFGCGMVPLLGLVGLIGAGMWAEHRRAATTSWAFVDRAGEVVLPGPFDEARPFAGGLAAVRVGQRWGFVTREGTAVAPRFLDVRDFSEGLAAAQDAGTQLWGYVDSSGGWAIEPTWHEAYPFAGGRAAVARAVGRTSSSISMGQSIYAFGLIDRSGEVVCAPATDPDDPERWSTAWELSEGLIAVQVDGERWGYARADGTWAIEPRFEAALPFSGGVAGAQQDGRWGVVRPDGTWLVKPRFGGVVAFREGLGAVEAAEGWAFVDPEGNVPFSERYLWVHPFASGLAAVRTDAGWGFVDRQGAERIAPQFADVAAKGFQDGRCAVTTTSGGQRVWRFITPEGAPAWEASYVEAQSFSEGLAAVRVTRQP